MTHLYEFGHLIIVFLIPYKNSALKDPSSGLEETHVVAQGGPERLASWIQWLLR